MDQENLQVTLVQADPKWESAAENLQTFTRHLQDAPGTHLIVLPEMFNTGFSMNPDRVAEPMTGRTVTWLRETARARNADVVGSAAIAEDGKYFNRLLWAKPDGRLLKYDKRHLFTFAGEHEKYTPGRSPLVVSVCGWNIAAFICYDLRFPVWSRNLYGRYDVALYIASWPERRAPHWRALLRARAIENQSYVLGVNRVGTDGNNISHSGDSMLIDPSGEVCSEDRDVEVIRQLVLSRALLNDVRSRFPFLKDADAHELHV